jgi:DNA-binding NtrC family response regulator
MHRILVVDDDRETCRLMTELLTRQDREIENACDPDEAEALLGSKAFDLMVTDINLNASESGLDLLRRFKSKHPAGQVLLVSAFGSLDTAVEGVRAGAFDYISKPFNISEVKATVERALARADDEEALVLPPPGAPPREFEPDDSSFHDGCCIHVISVRKEADRHKHGPRHASGRPRGSRPNTWR